MIRFRELRASEVEARVGACTQKGCSLLLYKDARVDMALLDETVGAGKWQCRYMEIGGRLFCEVGVLTDYDTGPQWVWKADVGVPSNMEATKGEASDAFKRACFKWGIGRELYTAPFIWVPESSCHVKKNDRSGKFQCHDRFEVSSMEVSDGRITALEVVNASYGGAVCFRMSGTGNGKSAPQGSHSKPQGGELERSREELKDVLRRFASKKGGSPEAEWKTIVAEANAVGRANDPSFWDGKAKMYGGML